MSPKLFPLIVLLLYLGAAVCYGWQGNWKEMSYALALDIFTRIVG